MFHSLRTALNFCSQIDKIVGFRNDSNQRTAELSINVVIQVCGLTKHWKHCIAFYLSKSIFKVHTLEKILKESFKLVESIRNEVLGVPSDQSANFKQSFYSRLDVIESDPKFSMWQNSYLVCRDAPHARNYLYNGNC